MTKPESLKGLLAERRPVLVKEWVRQVVDTYPADARRFLNEQKDPFANPVGRTLTSEMENLLQETLVTRWRQQVSDEQYQAFLESVFAREMGPIEAVNKLLT